MSRNSRQSFTLIELLIVIAIVAVLAVVVVMTLNPAQLLKQARDSTRLSDLATINQALSIYQADQISSNLGSSSVLYISIPDPTATTTQGTNCQGISGLTTSSLPSGWTWHCPASSTARNTDGTGWIPVNFSQISAGSPISNLPIDPINTTSSGNYYVYTIGSSSPSVWLISSLPESQKHKTTTSNPINLDGVFLTGNDYTISPIYNTQGLVGWWKFDEGSGSSTKDWSGNGRDIILNATSTWVGGKNGQAYNADAWWKAGTIPSYNYGTNISFSFWFYQPSDKGGPVISASTGGVFRFSYYINPRILFQTGLGSSPCSDGNWCGGFYSQIYSPNEWHHAVGIQNSSTSKLYLYIDGILYGSGSLSTVPEIDDSIKIGSGTGIYVDDVRVFDRVLSVAEIQGIFNSTR